MKKNLFFAIFIAISAVLIITSCKDEKKEMIESLNYKKACDLKDFSTAYEIVEKLKKEAFEAKHTEWVGDGSSIILDKENKYKEAEKYVVLQEAITVIEESGTNGLVRIVGIAKEHDAESWLYEELLDVARKIGDTDLTEEIIKILSS